MDRTKEEKRMSLGTRWSSLKKMYSHETGGGGLIFDNRPEVQEFVARYLKRTFMSTCPSF